jgi:hypothetical protein
MSFILLLFCLSAPQSSGLCEPVRDQIKAWTELAGQLKKYREPGFSDEEFALLWNRVDELSLPLRRLAELLNQGDERERQLAGRLDQEAKRLGELETAAEIQSAIHAVLAVLREAGSHCDGP